MLPHALALLLTAAPEAPACVPRAELAREREALRAANAAAREAALTRDRLTPVTLRAHRRILGQGLQPGPRAESEQGPTLQTRVDGVQGEFVVGDTRWTGDVGGAVQPEFVRDAAGAVYRLEAAPTATVLRRRQCECEPQPCFQPTCGSPCPGCGHTIQALYGPLPRGEPFKGPWTLRWVTTELLVETSSCEPVAPCPPPSPCPP